MRHVRGRAGIRGGSVFILSSPAERLAGLQAADLARCAAGTARRISGQQRRPLRTVRWSLTSSRPEDARRRRRASEAQRRRREGRKLCRVLRTVSYGGIPDRRVDKPRTEGELPAGFRSRHARRLRGLAQQYIFIMRAATEMNKGAQNGLEKITLTFLQNLDIIVKIFKEKGSFHMEQNSVYAHRFTGEGLTFDDDACSLQRATFSRRRRSFHQAHEQGQAQRAGHERRDGYGHGIPNGDSDCPRRAASASFIRI